MFITHIEFCLNIDLVAWSKIEELRVSTFGIHLRKCYKLKHRQKLNFNRKVLSFVPPTGVCTEMN